jgi:Mrp family chromosome partitioning ATPase/capsular polysaccharide biosynthesis protein
MEEPTKQPIDLRDVLRPVTSRLWLIVIVVALATALTYYHYNSQPKLYRAATNLYIGSTDPTQIISPLSSDRANTDLAALVNSPAVARIAAKNLGFKGNPAALVGAVIATPASGSDFISISTVSGNPVNAANLVNAFADAFISSRTDTLHAQARAAIDQDTRQLEKLPNTTDNAVQRTKILADLSQMQALLSLPVGIQHINAATPPGAPFTPHPKKNATFAFVITLLLAIGAAYGLERLDRRIRKLADAERIYGHSVLAAVPHTARPAPTVDGAAVLPDRLRESFRKLRLNLQLTGIDGAPKTIVVTSAVPREGKSTVTRNLALAYREAGLKVCVIDCDLRRPGLAKLLDVPITPGLTDVVVGDESLSGALKYATAGVPGLRTLSRLNSGSTDITSLSTNGNGDADHIIGSLVVLPSGPEIANPPVVLGSDQMRSILDTLNDEFDVVIIDTSPLLAVSDAVPLLSTADGVVLVSRLGHTTSDAAEEVVDQIRRVPGAHLLGLVVNDVRGRDAAMKRYSYGYGYGSTYDRATA